MDRSEALARLARSPRFQFVGERLVVRDVAILEAMKVMRRVEEETGAVVCTEARATWRRELVAA